MPRRVQDIIPAEHRSIRDIPVRPRASFKESSRLRKQALKEEENEIRESITIAKNRREEENSKDNTEIPISRIEVPSRMMPVTPPTQKVQSRIRIGKWPIITFVVIAAIVIAGYFASTYYSQATFTIIPKVVPVIVNGTYVAQSTLQSSGLSYEIITLKKSATSTVPAVNGALTNTKATGKVTFYNSYSSQSVRLIAGTRLTDGNDHVYRLASSIAIPAYTKKTDTIVPGKIVANIIADQAGQDYNISQTDSPIDLKIVAYANSPKYSTIYAKPVGAISGGFAGVKKIVSPSVMASTTANLKADISASLIEEIKSKIPVGYIMYDKGYVTTFTSPIIGGSSATSATISIDGTMYGIAFPINRLAETFAGAQTISLFGPFSYTVPGIETLKVVITNLKDFSPTKKGALVLSAKGNLKIVGTIPVEEIKKKLSGISLVATQDVFKLYSSVIESGSGELAPPWAKIPTDISRVKVIVEEP